MALVLTLKQPWKLLSVLCLGLVLAGCQSPPQSPTRTGASRAAGTPAIPAASGAEVERLTLDLMALAPVVGREEASALARAAVDGATDLACGYRVVRPAWLHNTFVNFGLKRRGLCYHWQEDLYSRLEAVERRELVLRLVVARQGTWREHNAVLVHARDQEPTDGLVLDAWRHGGRLHWAPFKADKYPWRLAE